MNAGSANYKKFVSSILSKDNVACIDNDEVRADQDWRNVAMNKALKYSNAEWIFFTEQDFYPLEGFWKETEDLMQRTEVFGLYQDARLHPCCFFISKEILGQTCKDFGVVKDRLDHFGRIQEDLESKEIVVGVVPKYLGEHMNGLSQNMYMLQQGQEPNYEPEKFKEYCKKCLNEDLHPDFINLFTKYIGGGD